MSAINPYINFAGTTEEAFGHYRSIFGGEFAVVMRFGEMPGCDEFELSDDDKTKIAHIALPIGTGGDVLMGTDMLECFGQKLSAGNNFALSYSPDSREEADRVFSALGDGGSIVMPIADQFWGSYHGMVIDRFGMQWMIDFDPSHSG